MKQLYCISLLICLTYAGGLEEFFTHGKGRQVQNESLTTGIMGGNEVPIQKHPYILAVLLPEENSYLFTGAAVLLNKRWAITAAVTVNRYEEHPEQVTVRAAADNALIDGQTSVLRKIIVHPEYGPRYKNDLALIKIASPFRFSEMIRSIQLAWYLPKEGSKTVVAGYGAQDFSTETDGKLREATVTLMYNSQCKQKYVGLTSTSICTSDENVGPCPLDFGDPLVYRNLLIGIFSGAYDCGSTKYPAIYADVTQYTRWIKNIIRK